MKSSSLVSAKDSVRAGSGIGAAIARAYAAEGARRPPNQRLIARPEPPQIFRAVDVCAHGQFVPAQAQRRETLALLHPRTPRRPWDAATTDRAREVLDFVHERGTQPPTLVGTLLANAQHWLARHPLPMLAERLMQALQTTCEN